MSKTTDPNADTSYKAYLSLRDRLSGAVVDFLSSENMACVQTQDGLVSLINALAHYREEGRPLFPEMFVFDDLEAVLQVIPGAEHIRVGEGDKTTATMSLALKRCAPLAQGGWVVYILRKPAAFVFGLLRGGATELSVPVSELLVDRGDPALPVLMVHQIAPNLVEVKGVLRSAVLVYFGAVREKDASPLAAVDAFTSSIASSVGSEIQEQTHAFLRRVFYNVLQNGHGTLAAVLSQRSRVLPPNLRDGVPLTPPLNIGARIADVLQSSDSAANMKLQATAALISGMLMSDGITVFGSDATVRGFNIFIKHPRQSGLPKAVSGGARRRTFDVLSGIVGNGLVSAFMQSQDGRVEFKG
jgi:hypothetical protein